MVHSFLDGDYNAVTIKSVVMGSLYVIMGAAVILDLCSGIRKAKAKGDFVSSFALRKTVDKLLKYFNVALVFSLMDITLSSLEAYNLPFATMLWTLIVCIIEVKSIYEKYDAKEKAKAKDAMRIIKYIANHKDEADGILDLLIKTKELTKKENKNDIDKTMEDISDRHTDCASCDISGD